MSIPKYMRKIVVDEKEYFWCIHYDRYYDGKFFNDYGTSYSLNVISADKKIKFNTPIGVDKPYDIPFDVPEAITPGFVRKFIEWSIQKWNL